MELRVTATYIVGMPKVDLLSEHVLVARRLEQLQATSTSTVPNPTRRRGR